MSWVSFCQLEPHAHGAFEQLLSKHVLFLADLWKVFCTEHEDFVVDTLRVPSWSSTPTSAVIDLLGTFDDT